MYLVLETFRLVAILNSIQFHTNKYS